MTYTPAPLALVLLLAAGPAIAQVPQASTEGLSEAAASPGPSLEPIQPRARRVPPSVAPTPAPTPSSTAPPTPQPTTRPTAVPPAMPSEEPSPAAPAKPGPTPGEAPATPPPARPSAAAGRSAPPSAVGKRLSRGPSLVLPTPPPTRPASLLDDLVLDLEGGVLGFLQNDQQYGRTGSAYTRSTVALDRNLFAAQRISFEARAFERHSLIFLYAPVDVLTRVRLDGDFTFRDEVFPRGAVVDHRYLFDGVRATYLYRFFEAHGLRLEGGATLGVRNAEVSLRQANGERFAAERDIGPVPALRGRARYDTAHGFYGLLDVDAGGTPPGTRVRGGILDAALTLGVPMQTGLDATLRLRYLAGGADVPEREIVNWAQFASASAGFRFSPRFFWGPEERR